MGMLEYDALVIAKIAAILPETKNCLTLGVPTLNFTHEWLREYGPMYLGKGRTVLNFDNAEGFFASEGFEQTDALDISAYEGANVIGDLNDAHLLDKFCGKKYDLVYDSGTLEHIFDVPTALKTVSSLVKPGGVVMHSSPTNGFMDHGFWQISPDLYRTYYENLGYEILTCAVFVLLGGYYAVQIDDNVYRTKGRKYIMDNIPDGIVVFAARKLSSNPLAEITLQDYYLEMHAGTAKAKKSRFFIPFGTPPATNS